MKDKDFIYVLIWTAVLLFLLLALASCKTKYVSVPEVHTEYVSNTDSIYLHDSIHVSDSIIMYMQGDTMFKTIYLNKYVFRDRYKYKTDTVIKTDSISYPVERNFTRWERIKIQYFGYILIVAIFSVVGLVLWLFSRRYSK